MSTPNEASDAQDRHTESKSRSRPPERILVVDDETLILQCCSKVLTTSGFRVDTAENGEVGYSALHDVCYGPDCYNLLITDNDMPKMSGVELVKKMRSECMALPVIMASANPPEDSEAFRLAAILVKPFTLANLVKTVKEILPSGTANSETPNLKPIARRLLACEAASGKEADARDTAAFHVCAKLRETFIKLIGVFGFHSLMTHALALAGLEVTWLLCCLEIDADGSMRCSDKIDAKRDSLALAEGEVVLVAHFLGLLANFIGPAITLRLLQEVWPKLENLDSLNQETQLPVL